MNHFTDKDGFDGIRSQPTWCFRAQQPPASQNPVGAYFTDLGPETKKLAVRLGIPRSKLRYIFTFSGTTGLHQLGKHGRRARIFYSPTDYDVERSRQQNHGETEIT